MAQLEIVNLHQIWGELVKYINHENIQREVRRLKFLLGCRNDKDISYIEKMGLQWDDDHKIIEYSWVGNMKGNDFNIIKDRVQKATDETNIWYWSAYNICHIINAGILMELCKLAYPDKHFYILQNNIHTYITEFKTNITHLHDIKKGGSYNLQAIQNACGFDKIKCYDLSFYFIEEPNMKEKYLNNKNVKAGIYEHINEYVYFLLAYTTKKIQEYELIYGNISKYYLP